MVYNIQILPRNLQIIANHGDNLLQVLRIAGAAPEAPCGGNGTCGKCRATVNGKEVLTCKIRICEDLTVVLPEERDIPILTQSVAAEMLASQDHEDFLLAFDIGTTTLVCYLLGGKTGQQIACAGMANPQSVYGGDVISRIRAALEGNADHLTQLIRNALNRLTEMVCQESCVDPTKIRRVCVVGNPAMQQLFLGVDTANLAAVPFAPALTEARTTPCGTLLPLCPDADLMIIPNISGYIGADTMGCILSTGLYQAEEMTLLVDIGTNGEMVLGNRHGMITCATAAGPALEGANIHFGMRAAAGAIDHVWYDGEGFRCSVIGGGKATGICGSGLIDAVAAAMEAGLLNSRGRILSTDTHQNPRVIRLTEEVFLTQEDIRQVQLAKGAIAAGIRLMADQLGITLGDIRHVLLAGAFGSFLNPASACRIGLIPAELESRITAVGNAAGEGAKLLVRQDGLLELSQQLTKATRHLELASLPTFPRTFAQAMRLP